MRALGGDGVGRVLDLLVEIGRVDGKDAVGARGHGGQGGEVDGGGHDEAAGVVGMLADKVDAARRGVNPGRLLPEDALMGDG